MTLAFPDFETWVVMHPDGDRVLSGLGSATVVGWWTHDMAEAVHHNERQAKAVAKTWGGVAVKLRAVPVEIHRV